MGLDYLPDLPEAEEDGAGLRDVVRDVGAGLGCTLGVVGRPQDAGHAPKFVKKAPDVADAAEAAADVLEGAEDAQGPAQTHAHVAHDVLVVLDAGAGPLEALEVTLPHLLQQKNSTTKQLDLALLGNQF